MSLVTPVFKFNNIYAFSAKFQKYIKSFNNVFSKKFEKIKDLSILNTVSSDINISFDIIRSTNEFNINFSNNSSPFSFENYQLEQIVTEYRSIINKLVTPINNIIYLFNNNTNNIGKEFTEKESKKLLCDLLNKIRKRNDQKQIIDIYISEYMNVPNSSSDIVNFIYFIRRFPLIRYLINHYLYQNYPASFNLIRKHNLDNINYLLFEKENIESDALKSLKNTGLFNFDYEYEDGEYDTSYRNSTDTHSMFKKTFENNFVNYCNGCKNIQLKKYNTIAAIENNNRIENVIYVFPFLYKISNLFQLKQVLKNIIQKIIISEIGVKFFEDKIYIKDPNEIMYTILENSEKLIDINTGFSFGFNLENNKILRNFILLFAYDMVINQIDVENVFEKLSIEDILIKMSTFILNAYGVYKRASLEEVQNRFYHVIGFNPDYFTPINVSSKNEINDYGFNIVDKNMAIYQNWYKILIPNEPKNFTYFYLFSAHLLFEDIVFKTKVEDDLYKMSHLFYIFNYFHNEAKELDPLFIFSAFSNGENKWIKNYNYKKNYFMDWLIEYFDYCFPNVKKYVID